MEREGGGGGGEAIKTKCVVNKQFGIMKHLL